MISTKAKLFNLLVKIIKPKRLLNPDKPKRSNLKVLPKEIHNLFEVSYQTIRNRLVATIFPHNNNSKHHIIYFHGGGFVFEATPLHWKMFKRIIAIFKCKLTFIEYPLTPENTFIQTFEMLEESFEFLINKFPDDKYIFMGDSAGGGLALAFAMKLKKINSKVQPHKLVLFSPWIDLRMTNPLYRDYEKRDNVISLELTKKMAERYAGGEDMSNYLISPVNGEFKDLTPAIVFFSKDELLYPDCSTLKSIVKDVNQDFIFCEYEKMQHAWLLLPIAESEKAIKQAYNFILK